MTEVFHKLIKESLIVWIDNLLGFAESLEKWYSTLEETLRLATERNIKFNLRKCDLFTRRVKFCERIFSPEGVDRDPDASRHYLQSRSHKRHEICKNF